MQNDSIHLINSYYQYFNDNDMHNFFQLLDENIIHDINEGIRQIGKSTFEKFMEHMNQCYREKIRDLVVMSNQDGTRAAAEFIVDGQYIATDNGLPPANNQHYTLPAGAFFEVEHDKIKRITTYYNLKKWLELVSK